MILPPGTGLLGLLAIAILSRRDIPIALIALFVSGAIAAKAPQAYSAFIPLFLAALTLYAIRQEERVLEKVLGLYLGIGIIWASNNGPIADVLLTISRQLVEPFFNAVLGAVSILSFGASLSALIAWSILSPRLMKIGEEEPLVAIGYVVLGNTVLRALIAAVPDYLRLGLAIGLLNQFSRAIRGNMEALGEIAPVLFIFTTFIPSDMLAIIGGVVSVIELGMGVLSKKHLAGSAMWATAITLV